MQGAHSSYSSLAGFSSNVIDLGAPSFQSHSSNPNPNPKSISAPPHTDETMMYKPRKIDRACDACRRKKTKCDGPKMPDHICSNCIQTRKNCTYVEASKPRGPPKAYVTGLEDKLEKMEALLKRLRPDTDFSPQLGPPIIRGSWKTEDPLPRLKLEPSSSAEYLPISPISPAGRRKLQMQSFPTPDAAAFAVAYRCATGTFHPYPNQPQASSSSLSTHLLSNHRTRKRPRTSSPPQQKPGPTIMDPHSSDCCSSSDSEDLGELSLARGMKRLTVRGVASTESGSWVDNQMRFHGKSSSFKLIGATRKLREQHMSESELSTSRMSPLRRPEFWTTPPWEVVWEGLQIKASDLLGSLDVDLPPADLAADLIELYFFHVNSQYPLLHRPTFERQWQSDLAHRDSWYACLCLALFALASRWSNDPRLVQSEVKIEDGEPPASGVQHHMGYRWMLGAVDIHRAQRSVLHPACLFEVQSFTLISMYLRGSLTHQPVAWVFISIGLRKAQDVGAHRKRVYSRKPSTEEELWKRAFWTLVALDRFASANLGRPCCAGEEDFDLVAPLEVDDEYWETEDPAQAFRQPAGKPALAAAFNSWLHLSQVVAFALRTIYAIDKSKVMFSAAVSEWKEKVVKQMNAALSEWVESVPEHLKWSNQTDNNFFSNQASCLYLTYHYIQILIHRPFIPAVVHLSSTTAPTSALAASALSICVNAAKSCARIIAAQMHRGLSNVPHMVSVAHICAAILLMNVWDLRAREKIKREDGDTEDVKPPIEKTVEALMTDVYIFIDALEWAALTWDSAREALQNLRPSLPGSTVDDADSPPDEFLSDSQASSIPTSYDRRVQPTSDSSGSIVSSSPHRSTPEFEPGQGIGASTGQWYPGQDQAQIHPYAQYPARPTPLSLYPPDYAAPYWQKQAQVQAQTQEQQYALDQRHRGEHTAVGREAWVQTSPFTVTTPMSPLVEHHAHAHGGKAAREYTVPVGERYRTVDAGTTMHSTPVREYWSANVATPPQGSGRFERRWDDWIVNRPDFQYPFDAIPPTRGVEGYPQAQPYVRHGHPGNEYPRAPAPAPAPAPVIVPAPAPQYTNSYRS